MWKVPIKARVTQSRNHSFQDLRHDLGAPWPLPDISRLGLKGELHHLTALEPFGDEVFAEFCLAVREVNVFESHVA
jgi:hypothetical protein